MTPELVDFKAICDRWWALVVRGVAAIVFGVLAILVPQISLVALVFLWGAYAFVDGIFNVVLAFWGARFVRSWGWLLFEGLCGIAAGMLTFIWPQVTALGLLIVIAAWAVATGVAEIAAAFRLRRHIQGEWLLALSGVLSIAFGVLLLARPGAGALAVVSLIGAYAIVFGVLLVVLGVRLRRWSNVAERLMPTEEAPPLRSHG